MKKICITLADYNPRNGDPTTALVDLEVIDTPPVSKIEEVTADRILHTKAIHANWFALMDIENPTIRFVTIPKLTTSVGIKVLLDTINSQITTPISEIDLTDMLARLLDP